MKGNAGFDRDRLLLAAAVVALAAGCGGQQSVVPDEGVAVARMERPVFNAPTEPGLFRITFDARRAGEIRREAANFQAPEGMDPYASQRWLLDREAAKELHARGLCNGSVNLVSIIDEGDGKSGFSAIFKCRPSLF
jgi:hypothetical protein